MAMLIQFKPGPLSNSMDLARQYSDSPSPVICYFLRGRVHDGDWAIRTAKIIDAPVKRLGNCATQRTPTEISLEEPPGR